MAVYRLPFTIHYAFTVHHSQIIGELKTENRKLQAGGLL